MSPRVMLDDDLAEVHGIETSANRFPWSVKNFSDSLDAGHHAWVYIDPYDVIIGFAIVQLVLDEAHLLNICVRPDMQGQGYGRRILEHIIDHAMSKSATLLVLEVRQSNQRAQSLYEQFGFNEMTVRRGYYPAEQGREDAILMGLDLSMLSVFGGL
ncbi:ribosomal-protein-alanine acetyltransferase [Methylophaga thiooxydans DMS010]|uniref:[Ribosomal protein bS18]-alanine N-acetyltransferase n=2 Tax=Methylophaga thiooxydans TaxID=392484 RepID=C0N9N6_9GAMM|nr:ribosomal-protein-alanine acetyltransferase [Methylophaga thiooxydans DMS010]